MIKNPLFVKLRLTIVLFQLILLILAQIPLTVLMLQLPKLLAQSKVADLDVALLM